MTDTGTDQQPPAKNEPRLFRIKVDGKACYAWKWSDKREASGREVNYVLRDPTMGKDQYLQINCPLRIAGSTELVSVQSTGRPTLVADTIVWESAETVWDDCSTADDCTIRSSDPEKWDAYRDVLRRFKQMLREFNEGTGKCSDLTQPAPATSELAPKTAAVPQARTSETDLTTIANQAAEMAVEKVGNRMVAEDARRQTEAADVPFLLAAKPGAKGTAQKTKAPLPGDRVDPYAFLWRLSGVEGAPTAADKLIKAYARQRSSMQKNTEKIDVCRKLAHMEYETARKNPNDCPWLERDKANAVNKAAVSGREAFTKADVERHAQTLKKRLNRTTKTPPH